MKKRIVNRRKSYKTRAMVVSDGRRTSASLPNRASDRSEFYSTPDGYFIWIEDKERKKR